MSNPSDPPLTEIEHRTFDAKTRPRNLLAPREPPKSLTQNVSRGPCPQVPMILLPMGDP